MDPIGKSVSSFLRPFLSPFTPGSAGVAPARTLLTACAQERSGILQVSFQVSLADTPLPARVSFASLSSACVVPFPVAQCFVPCSRVDRVIIPCGMRRRGTLRGFWLLLHSDRSAIVLERLFSKGSGYLRGNYKMSTAKAKRDDIHFLYVFFFNAFGFYLLFTFETTRRRIIAPYPAIHKRQRTATIFIARGLLSRKSE